VVQTEKATDMPGLKCILLTSILSLNCIVPIVAGALEDGIAAFRGGDYATAIQLLRQFAERGNPSAQFYLGFMYANARGVPKNYAEALKWYRLAADQGLASAQHNLGFMYANGWGVEQDHVEAVKWYRLASNQGYAGAQNELGYDYLQGRGVPRNYGEALKWFAWPLIEVTLCPN
jgi:uncharacterized protein